MSDLEVSFEFFPPKSEAMRETLWASVGKLAPLRPQFVSVTYGAGGSTRERTHQTVARIIKETDLRVAAHLTTVAATQDEVDSVLRDYWAVGVRQIVALRGDPPGGIGTAFEATEGGYENAAALTAAARRIGDFEVTVGCYPEKHPESRDFELDIELLKRKVDAGATRAITQFFYDNDVFDAYVERVRAAGIDIPIVPGIMPIANYVGMRKMADKMNVRMPPRLERLYENLDDDPETRRLVSATVTAEQCFDLLERGVTQFHFYTLNRADLSYAACHMLGIRPQEQPR
jgi:methylenetetrahydrofolate reductase (NADPH)